MTASAACGAIKARLVLSPQEADAGGLCHQRGCPGGGCEGCWCQVHSCPELGRGAAHPASSFLRLVASLEVDDYSYLAGGLILLLELLLQIPQLWGGGELSPITGG